MQILWLICLQKGAILCNYVGRILIPWKEKTWKKGQHHTNFHSSRLCKKMDEQFLTKRRSETRIQTQLLSQHGGLATSYTKKWMVQIMSCTREKEEKKLSPTFASFNFFVKSDEVWNILSIHFRSWPSGQMWECRGQRSLTWKKNNNELGWYWQKHISASILGWYRTQSIGWVSNALCLQQYAC